MPLKEKETEKSISMMHKNEMWQMSWKWKFFFDF